jgi:uncharacterized protein (TIGR02217 family)
MPITVLHDVVMPNSVIAAGVKGKNMRLNSRVPTDNGFESINIGWSQTLRQYELGIVPMTVTQWQAIETLHEITEGGAYGFLMEDPKDNHVSTGGVFQRVDPPPGADPSGTFYQMIKRYIDPISGRTKDRRITRPNGLISVYESGVLTAASVSPLDGIATIAGDPDVSVVTWTGSFYVPVHFVDDVIDWELVVAGPAGSRFLAGPSVLLQEVRE